jgi:hypothetical protein
LIDGGREEENICFTFVGMVTGKAAEIMWAQNIEPLSQDTYTHSSEHATPNKP